MPNPNRFDGQVLLRRAGDAEWRDVPVRRGYTGECRGLGVADMARSVREGHPHRASAELAYHVLDIMHSFHEASEQGRHVEVTSGCPRPEPLPADLLL